MRKCSSFRLKPRWTNMFKKMMLFRDLCWGHAKCLHHNISHSITEDIQYPWLNFIANCHLFEAFGYHMVTLEMVHLIPVILWLETLVLQLPQALCEIGEEQRECELNLWQILPLAYVWIQQCFMSLSFDSGLIILGLNYSSSLQNHGWKKMLQDCQGRLKKK